MAMFLNSTTDINTAVNLVNSQVGLLNPEVFYSKQLLDTIRLDANEYTYFRYADAAPIQEKADKLTMRRWAPLQAHTVPLVEGIPPMSDKGSVEKYELQAYSYGRYMEFTDKVDWKAVDPIIAHYSQEYSIVAVETLDLLAQKALLQVAQKYYAGLKTSISTMTIADCKPAIADLRLIGLSLTKKLVKPRNNGKFPVIISPEFEYDMIDDLYVQKYMEYNNTTTPIYDNGALVPMFGFEFFKVMNCPSSGEYVNASSKRVIPVYRKWDTTGSIVLNGKTYKAEDADAKGYIYGTVTESDAPYDSSSNPTGTWTRVSGYVNDSRTGRPASYIPDQFVWKIPEGWKELKVQHTMILGKDALMRTGLAGEDNAKMYVKPLGSAGVLDPIDQRQSIGFKINSVGFGSMRTEAVVDYVNIPTQLNV